MKQPPLLPDETLHRVLRVANFDGFSVLAVAGTLALASASLGDIMGAAIGLSIAAAGAIELHGAGLLRAGERRGMNWLIASQPYLALVVVCYCVLRIANFDPAVLQQVMPAEMKNSFPSVRSEEQFARTFNQVGYGILGVGTLIYQGAMTVFYYRRRDVVTAALEAGEEWPEI